MTFPAFIKLLLPVLIIGFCSLSGLCQNLQYKIVGTGQSNSYNNSGIIALPAMGQSFFGQNTNHPGLNPSYTDNNDGTITDNNT